MRPPQRCARAPLHRTSRTSRSGSPPRSAWGRSEQLTAATFRPPGAGRRSSRCGSSSPGCSSAAPRCTAAVSPPSFLGGLTGLAAWTWLSLAWTDNTTQTVLEGFRMLAYAGVAAAFVLVVRRETAPALLRGVLAGLVLISAYGLLTRLLPRTARRLRHGVGVPALRAARLLERLRHLRHARPAPRARRRGARAERDAPRAGGGVVRRPASRALLHVQPRRVDRSHRGSRSRRRARSAQAPADRGAVRRRDSRPDRDGDRLELRRADPPRLAAERRDGAGRRACDRHRGVRARRSRGDRRHCRSPSGGTSRRATSGWPSRPWSPW